MMASRILGRKLFSGPGAHSALRRQLSTSTRLSYAAPTEEDVFRSGRPTPEQEAQMKLDMAGKVKATRAYSPMDVHTVEDIHHLSAEEALAETGTRRDATLRHFTGTNFAGHLRLNIGN